MFSKGKFYTISGIIKFYFIIKTSSFNKLIFLDWPQLFLAKCCLWFLLGEQGNEIASIITQSPLLPLILICTILTSLSLLSFCPKTWKIIVCFLKVGHFNLLLIDSAANDLWLPVSKSIASSVQQFEFPMFSICKTADCNKTFLFYFSWFRLTFAFGFRSGNVYYFFRKY